MPHYDRITRLIAAAFCAALMVGCVAADPGSPAHNAAVVPYPPPAKRAEIPPPAPASDMLWLAGHWRWDGAKYQWIPGAYTPRPTPTANWMPGYWDEQAEGWVWTEGHWQS